MSKKEILNSGSNRKTLAHDQKSEDSRISKQSSMQRFKLNNNLTHLMNKNEMIEYYKIQNLKKHNRDNNQHQSNVNNQQQDENARFTVNKVFREPKDVIGEIKLDEKEFFNELNNLDIEDEEIKLSQELNMVSQIQNNKTFQSVQSGEISKVNVQNMLDNIGSQNKQNMMKKRHSY